MSEQAPERKPKHDNIFTRKIGPLPMWAWLGIATAVIAGWALYKNKTTSTSPSSTTDASQVPQFVNQTYTSVTPPSSPTPAPVTTPSPDQGGGDDGTGQQGGGDNDNTGTGQPPDKGGHKKTPVKRKHPTHHAGSPPVATPPGIAGGGHGTPVGGHPPPVAQPVPVGGGSGSVGHQGGPPVRRPTAPKKSKEPPRGQSGLHNPGPRVHG